MSPKNSSTRKATRACCFPQHRSWSFGADSGRDE